MSAADAAHSLSFVHKIYSDSEDVVLKPETPIKRLPRAARTPTSGRSFTRLPESSQAKTSRELVIDRAEHVVLDDDNTEPIITKTSRPLPPFPKIRLSPATSSVVRFEDVLRRLANTKNEC